MSDYTVEEVEEAVSNLHLQGWDGWDEFAYSNSDSYRYGTPINFTLRGEEVTPKIVEADTGGEGHGEDCFIVFQVGEQLFKKEGWYASHYGTEWDGALYEVEPVQRTVTLYEKKA